MMLASRGLSCVYLLVLFLCGRHTGSNNGGNGRIETVPAGASAFVIKKIQRNNAIYPSVISESHYYLTTNAKSRRICTSSGTALQMGLKSFFRNRRNNVQEESTDTDDRKNEKSGKKKRRFLHNFFGSKNTEMPPSDTTRDADPSDGSDPSENSADEGDRKKVRMGEDPDTKEIDVRETTHGLLASASRLAVPETAQERINRVKSGIMTEAEKEAFLQTALTAGVTSRSRKPFPRAENPKPSSVHNHRKLHSTPFPKDSMLRDVARGRRSRSGNQGDVLDSAILDSQRKKREYLDMVTNPNRFHTYRTANSIEGGNTTTATMSPGTTTFTSNAVDERPMNLIVDTSLDTKVDDGHRGITTNKGPPGTGNALPKGLGARLGAAAMAKQYKEVENRRQAEIQRKEEEKQKEQQRLDYERKMEALQRRWQEDAARNEAKSMERKRQEEEKRAREEEEKRRAEEERMQELVKAQEEYWAKKLTVDKKARQKRMATEGQGHEKETQNLRVNQKEENSELIHEEVNMDDTNDQQETQTENSSEVEIINSTNTKNNIGPGPVEAVKEKTAQEKQRTNTATIASVSSKHAAEADSLAKKKGPIRQKLPLDGIDSSDWEGADKDGIDFDVNEKLTISEALKRSNGSGESAQDQAERSKRWGIDMSRFQD